MPAVQDGTLTTSSAARLLRVSEQTVRVWVRDGRLPAEITPLGALFDPATVEALRRSRAQSAAAPRIRTRQIGRSAPR